MSFPTSTIKSIIEGLTGGPEYVRASTLEDLNEKSDGFNNSVIAVHTDLPNVPHKDVFGTIVREYPVEVLFLTRDQPDSPSEDEDTIRDSMLSLADEFYDKLSSSSIASPTNPVEGYDVNAASTTKILDDVYTGVSCEFILYIDRSSYADVC